ncbi:hypothetical protein BpHYR1_023489 [Brachionus plicatilis]|uniref:Uncharacterized protein n=1 Tax=Brachionus plicatilis TaxID=10195 RepID=A0A3M7RNF7_BRAPC|nr:hypothetical protein BpHYR1_023489 [Brachionus plicatilis]
MNIQESEEFKIFTKLSQIGLIDVQKFCTNKNCKSFGKAFSHDLRNRNKSKIDKSNDRMLTWRCKTCTTYSLIYSDSFFGLFRKPIKLVLAIIKCWSAQLTVAKVKAVKEMGKVSLFGQIT